MRTRSGPGRPSRSPPYVRAASPSRSPGYVRGGRPQGQGQGGGGGGRGGGAGGSGGGRPGLPFWVAAGRGIPPPVRAFLESLFTRGLIKVDDLEPACGDFLQRLPQQGGIQV